MCTEAVKRLQDEVPHLVCTNGQCIAVHIVELAVKTVNTEVDYFKALKDT